ncbi:MAG: NADH-quinone oxidoreductase subunit K [Desulfovermiculus sp.]|nr:NADH-quinone oxidoreductase subunit K [Desulfovermiculus sp.]
MMVCIVLVFALLMNALSSLYAVKPELRLHDCALLLLPAAGVAGLLLFAFLKQPLQVQGLGPAVQDALPQASFAYPVTAVLRDFRGYDTWLELGVLLAAVLGVMSLRSRPGLEGDLPPGPPEPVGSWIVNIILHFMILTGGHLLWLGSTGPGGAFQSGVILAAAGVLLWQSGRPCLCALPRISLRIFLAAGFSAFLLLAAHPDMIRKIMAVNVMAGGVFLFLMSLAYAPAGGIPDPVPQAMVLTGIVVSISATAFALFLAKQIREKMTQPDQGQQSDHDQ